MGNDSGEVLCREKKEKMVIKGGGGSAGKEEGLGSRGPLPTAMRKKKNGKSPLLVCSWR